MTNKMADQEDGVRSADNLNSLLSSSGRDFLIRNNGDEVKVESLKGKKIGLYFAASWCGPCLQFTPTLAELYNELLPKGDFEIVFVSSDKNDKAFEENFQKMPWLAIPFSDSETRNRLDEFFNVEGIPLLAILDENANVLHDDAVEVINEYGVEGYPFTPERKKEILEEEEAARRNQSLRSVLVSQSRDYVISGDGKKKPVSELEGKIVGLYFAMSTDDDCEAFTPHLNEMYKKLKEKGENFEIVMIPLDDDEEEFEEWFEGLPWYSLPFKDKSCERLIRYFRLCTVPTLVIIGPEGKTRNQNVAEAIEDYGVEAYPFTHEKFAELEEIEEAKHESQTLESILVSEDRNFVIGKDGIRIRVSDLVGKHILIYFSAKWCPPCRVFLPTLVEAYDKMRAKDYAFEVIFVSSDRDQQSFDEHYSQMPWLALPFGDERKRTLSRHFKVHGIPMLVAIGPNGKTVTTDGRSLIMYHGADAYPFTEDRLKEFEAQYEEMAKGWPKKVKHPLHKEHKLVLSRTKIYTCDACDKGGLIWTFDCKECEFYLHPECALKDKKERKRDAAKCALKDKKEAKDDDAAVEVEGRKPEEGLVCEGDGCHQD